MAIPRKDRLILLRATDEWIRLARYLIEEIGMWRDVNPSDTWWALYRGKDPQHRARMPDDLWLATEALTRAAATEYRNLNPSPLSDVYVAAVAWLEDYISARETLPPQHELKSALDRALFVVCAIRNDLFAQDRAEREAAAPRVEVPGTVTSAEDAAGWILTTQAAVCDFLGRSPNTTRALDELKRAGVLDFERVSKRKVRVRFTDPLEQERFRKWTVASRDRKLK